MTEKPSWNNLAEKAAQSTVRQAARIAALESQLAEARAGLKNLSKRLCVNHAATMCGDRYLRNDGKCEMCEANARIEALTGTNDGATESGALFCQANVPPPMSGTKGKL